MKCHAFNIHVMKIAIDYVLIINIIFARTISIIYIGPLFHHYHIISTSYQFLIHKMVCTFSGVFYVHNVRDKYLDCIFIDEYKESHQLSILHYNNPSGRNGPFPEMSQYITSGHVYMLHGTMTIIDKDYLHPSVLSSFSLCLYLYRCKRQIAIKCHIIRLSMFLSLHRSLPSI